MHIQILCHETPRNQSTHSASACRPLACSTPADFIQHGVQHGQHSSCSIVLGQRGPQPAQLWATAGGIQVQLQQTTCLTLAPATKELVAVSQSHFLAPDMSMHALQLLLPC
jgi:hypothetical protein